jgi:hypothetical protein
MNIFVLSRNTWKTFARSRRSYPSLSLEELRRAGYNLRGYFEAIDEIASEQAMGMPKDADLNRGK